MLFFKSEIKADPSMVEAEWAKELMQQVRTYEESRNSDVFKLSNRGKDQLIDELVKAICCETGQTLVDKLFTIFEKDVYLGVYGCFPEDGAPHKKGRTMITLPPGYIPEDFRYMIFKLLDKLYQDHDEFNREVMLGLKKFNEHVEKEYHDFGSDGTSYRYCTTHFAVSYLIRRVFKDRNYGDDCVFSCLSHSSRGQNVNMSIFSA